MKRTLTFLFVSLLIIFAVLALWGNRMLARTLDAQLPHLLSRELGIAVHLEPLTVNVLQLSASSSRLVMGNSEEPAVVAENVAVSLSLSSLLDRQIRLASARAATLTVQPSRWPVSSSPGPTDYRFLDQWLPTTLAVDQGSYVIDTAQTWPVKQLRWQRQGDGSVSVGGTAQLKPTAVEITGRLHSLDELLGLERLRLQMTTTAEAQKDSNIDLTIDLQPGAGHGYTLDGQIEVAGSHLKLQASNTQAWRFPEQSTTSVDKLDITALRQVLARYDGSAGTTDTATALASKLPPLSFPSHQGAITVAVLQYGKERLSDSSVNFITGANGVTFSELRATGPAGLLHAEGTVSGNTQGWDVQIKADIKATQPEQSLAGQFLDSQWLWHAGKADIHGKGANWGDLLDSLQGHASIAGAHRGAVHTPVSASARLDSSTGRFALEDMEIHAGEAVLKGEMSMSGSDRRNLALDLSGEKLNLEFLFRTDSTDQPLPGLALPEFLVVLPGIDLAWNLDLKNIELPGIVMPAIRGTLSRTATRVALEANVVGVKNGTLELKLNATTATDQPTDVDLVGNLNKFDIPGFFERELALLDTRTTGTVHFKSRGKGLENVFKQLRGTAELDVELRRDGDWARKASNEESIKLSGTSSLVIKKQRILGLQISELDIESIAQEITGTLSLVAGERQWLVADLRTDRLNLDKLTEWMPREQGGQNKGQSLAWIQDQSGTALSLDANLVTLMGIQLEALKFKVASEPGKLVVEQLDFTAVGGSAESHGEVAWQASTAQLKLQASIANFDLDSFLIENPDVGHVPVSGSISLQSNGSDVDELLANLNGEVDLQSRDNGANTPPAQRRKLTMRAERVDNGMLARVDSFQWADSELSGHFKFTDTQPPMIELDIADGRLSLLPWENSLATPTKPKELGQDAESGIADAAKASASFVGRILMMPARLVTGPGEATADEKLFSAAPLPIDWMQKYDVKISGKLSAIQSSVGDAEDLEFSVLLDAGELTLNASAGKLNYGSGELNFLANSNATPPTANTTISFQGVRSAGNKDSFPRSGFTTLTSTGNSIAELAGNASGVAYVSLGRGLLDYGRMMFLTADLATTVYQTLIPGIDKKKPELDCGVTLLAFKDGKGVTPYSFAARTPQANLVGRLEVDLKTEMLQLEFSSSSRAGLGLSVGNVFSNTIKVSGPLTDPEVVPNTTSILWRGWAAIMTGGLSVVGESMLKRALASEDPCAAVEKHIQKDLCRGDSPAARSALVCPAA